MLGTKNGATLDGLVRGEFGAVESSPSSELLPRGSGTSKLDLPGTC